MLQPDWDDGLPEQIASIYTEFKPSATAITRLQS